MYLSNLRFPEVEALDPARILVVCNIGALEQHSLHMPLGTDHLLGSAVVRRLEAALPDRLLCLPTIWPGCSSHHLGFAGTISLSTNTMTAILSDIVESVEASGFKRLLVVNSHGGNRAVLGTTIQALGQRASGLCVAGVSYWDTARDGLMAARETPPGGMGHACELETSLMLVEHPELVRMDLARADGHQPASRFTWGEILAAPVVSVYKTFAEQTEHGGFGDPTSASAAKGEAFFDIVNTAMLELCEDMLGDRL